MFQPRLPSGAALVVVDVAVALWLLVCVALGVAVADGVRELTALSDTVSDAGRAVQDSGRALGSLSDLPLVGGQLGGAGRQIGDAGRGVVAEGAATRQSIERTADLLGLAVGLIPMLPVLLLYAPPRVGRAAEVRAVRCFVADGAGDPLLLRTLAERGLANLSYREMRRVSPRPWRDLEEGRYEELARAELRRVGVSPRLLRERRR